MRSFCLILLAFLGFLAGPLPGLAEPGADAAAVPGGRIAQLPRYTASGLHHCDSGNSCVVTGLFSDCNEARSVLQTRDCCRTAKGDGKSTGFALTYCIPEMAR